MKYQPWDLNQTWPVGRKCCQKFLGPSLPKFAAQKNIIFYHLFAPSTLDTAYLWNETSRRQTKMLVSVYNVPPKRWPTFRDLWPRNGWDFAHCDPPFGGHYVATIKVATCLVCCKVMLCIVDILFCCPLCVRHSQLVIVFTTSCALCHGWSGCIWTDGDTSFTKMLMQYDGSSAESASVSRPKGLISALDQVEVCLYIHFMCRCLLTILFFRSEARCLFPCGVGLAVVTIFWHRRDKVRLVNNSLRPCIFSPFSLQNNACHLPCTDSVPEHGEEENQARTSYPSPEVCLEINHWDQSDGGSVMAM